MPTVADSRAPIGVVRGRDRRVEAARGAERDREDRPVAVDRVVGEQDRDVQPRLLDRDVLEVVDLRRVGEAEDASRRRPCASASVICPSESSCSCCSFSFERHPPQQRVDLALDGLAGGRSRVGCSARSSLDVRDVAATAPTATSERTAIVAPIAAVRPRTAMLILPGRGGRPAAIQGRRLPSPGRPKHPARADPPARPGVRPRKRPNWGLTPERFSHGRPHGSRETSHAGHESARDRRATRQSRWSARPFS